MRISIDDVIDKIATRLEEQSACFQSRQVVTAVRVIVEEVNAKLDEIEYKLAKKQNKENE